MPRFLAPILCLFFSAAAVAGPADINRVIKVIDFEERRLGNSEDLPMHWVKFEGPGLPHYVNGRLATDQAHSGQYSFRFDLNGGSLIYHYEPGQVRVEAGAHYRVEAFVRTTVMPNARARLSAYFTDADGHAIAGTTRYSALYAAARPGEDWHRLVVEVTPDTPGATYLVLELGLLQPNLYAPSVLGDRTLFAQDITGTAWWDDVTVSQVPELTLSSGRPGNVYRRSDPLRLSVLVNDRSTDDLAAQLIIKDAAGAEVYQRSGALDMSAAQTLGPGQKRMALLLPDLKPGWYQASLVMSSRGQFVGEQSLSLVRLADDAPLGKRDGRFGIIATDLPFAGWWALPEILPYLSAGRVKLAVWSEAGDIQQVDGASFDSLLQKLQEIGVTPTACLIAPPASLGSKMGGRSWDQLLKTDPEVWRSELAYMISRHANHLDRWQFGADKDADEFVQRPEMRLVYQSLYKEFAKLIDRPDLAMPWPAWYDLTGQLPATVALSVPPEVLPAQLPLYMQDLRRQPGHNLSLSLQLLEPSYGREERIRDLAQRVTYALAGGASRIDLPLPFTVRSDGDQVVDEPQEMLLIEHTLITMLAGAEYKGRVPIAENVEAFLFDRDGEGILVLWNRGNEKGAKELKLSLGASPMRVDLWGNVTPLLRPPGAVDQVSVEVGPMPMFITDIDSVAAQIRASLCFDQPLLESSFQSHTRHIRFTNPGHTTIGGSLKLSPPPGWTLSPSILSFSLNPGETFDREITIEFPYNSYAGAKTIQAALLIQGEKNVSFTAPVVLNLGLSDVGLQSLALRDKNDLIVQQMITNYSDHPIDYVAFAVYPGQARQERLVTNLGPGRTTIKLYRFTNAKFLPDAKVRSGVKEQTGARILNDEAAVQ